MLDDTANVEVNPLDDGIGPISASPLCVDASQDWLSTYPKVLVDTIVQSTRRYAYGVIRVVRRGLCIDGFEAHECHLDANNGEVGTPT